MAQLNFQIPDDLLARLDAQKPNYLDRKGFLCLILDQALDSSDTLVSEGAAEDTSTSISTSKEKKSIKLKDIYSNLEKHENLIREFWQVKKGSKSDQSWALLMTELTKLQKLYGDTVVEEQLRLAINGLWKGVSVRLYEQFKAPKGNTPAQPETRHPASRVFTAARGFDDEPVTNPVLKELF